MKLSKNKFLVLTLLFLVFLITSFFSIKQVSAQSCSGIYVRGGVSSSYSIDGECSTWCSDDEVMIPNPELVSMPCEDDPSSTCYVNPCADNISDNTCCADDPVDTDLSCVGTNGEGGMCKESCDWDEDNIGDRNNNCAVNIPGLPGTNPNNTCCGESSAPSDACTGDNGESGHCEFSIMCSGTLENIGDSGGDCYGICCGVKIDSSGTCQGIAGGTGGDVLSGNCYASCGAGYIDTGNSNCASGTCCVPDPNDDGTGDGGTGDGGTGDDGTGDGGTGGDSGVTGVLNLPTVSGLPDPAGGVSTVLVSFLNWLLGIIGLFAMIAFAISGVQYFLVSADEGMAEKAKRNMTYSIIGIVVAISGYVIITAIDIALNGGGVF